MNGWIPVWIMNIIQKNWPIKFILGMQKQLEKKLPFNSIYYELFPQKTRPPSSLEKEIQQ